MNIAKFSVKHPVTISILVVIMLMFGVVSLSMLSVDLMPDMELPVVLVMTTYEDAGPEEVEDSVTKVIEQNMASISGLETIRSTSSAGMSMVMMQFTYGIDLNETMNSVRDKVSTAKFSLPDKCGDSTIMKMDFNSMPIMMVSVASNAERSMDEMVKIANDTIAPRLERIDGVASAKVLGGDENQVQVILDDDKLSTYGLNSAMVGQMIGAENQKNSLGYVDMGSRKILLNIDGEFKNLGAMGNMPITLQSGDIIKLSDIAEIKMGKPDASSYVYMNGKQVLAIAIQKESGGNTVNVDKAVKGAIEELNNTIYDDIELDVPYTSADMIVQSANNVETNLLLAAVISMIIIFVFLGSLRSTVIIGVAIPVSLITTFNLLYFNGDTLNMITLGALALSVGMIVDNSTVVLENIYRHINLGKSRYRASVEGTKEVAGAVVASTLTTVAVYVPMVFISGMAAEMLRPFALTMCFALLGSLVVSLTVVPMMSSKLLILNNTLSTKKGIGSKFSNLGIHYLNGFNKFFNRFTNAYGRALNGALNHKVISMLVVTGALVGSFCLIPLIGTELIPAQDAGEVDVSISLRNNTTIENTWEVAQEVQDLILDLPETDKVLVTVGNSGMMMGGSTDSASIILMLTDKNERERSDKDIAAYINEQTKLMPGVEVVATAGDSMSSMTGDDISVEIKGNNLADLREFSDNVVDAIATIDGVSNVKSSMEDANDELSVTLDRDKAAFYNVSSSTVTSTIQLALNGMTVSSYKGSSDEIDIVAKMPDDMVENLDDIRRLMIATTTGGQVPLDEIASIEMTKGQSSIARIDQSRIATVTGDINGRDLGSASKDVEAVVKTVPVPNTCSVDFGGGSSNMNDTFIDLFKVIALALLMVYGVMACQFESLLLPLIIMVSLPVMFIGVFVGLLISGQTINMMSLMGVLLLEGVVVNNAIVLVDYVQTLRRDGMCKREAVLESGKTRMKPILMTTLTTVLAMLPQLLSNATGSETFKPMAATVVFGLAFSTVISLFVVPIIYELNERFLRHKKKNDVDDEELMQYTLMLPDECDCWKNLKEREAKKGDESANK